MRHLAEWLKVPLQSEDDIPLSWIEEKDEPLGGRFELGRRGRT